MYAQAPMRALRKLAFIVPILALAGCGQGDGPDSIAGTPAPPEPPLPAGFCDPITFEDVCPNRIASLEEFEGGPITILPNPQIDANNDSATVARMQKFQSASGQTFGGGRLNLTIPFEVEAGDSFTINVWSPRPVAMELQAGIATVETNHGGTGWEVLTFNLGGASGDVGSMAIIFDNGTNGNAGVDPFNWTFYFDDIALVPPSGLVTPIDPDTALYTTAGREDLVVPGDYAERTPFGSGSVIDEFYADDTTYNPVLSVFSGAGYGANVAQVGFIGFRPGFLGAYLTVDFKVKGMPNEVVFVKLFDGIDALRINLTSSDFAGPIGDGWYQVSIPLSRFTGIGEASGIVFESDNSSPAQFRMLLTDIGFSGVGDNPPEVADSGIIPEAVVYASDPAVAEDLGPPGGIQNFGSGAVFDSEFAGDFDFNPSLQVTSGEGYGAGVHVGFAAFTGYAAGFAAGYETLHFKVKGDAANLAAFEVKFFAGPGEPDTSRTYDATSYTALGNGWYQVSVPMSDFPTAATNNGFLLGPFGGQAAPFTFLMTDIGFSGTVGADPGIVPEAIAYSSDPAVAEDFGPPGGIQNFGSGAVFVDVLDDPDFAKVLQTTSGEGYGPGVHVGFAAFPDYAAGFAAGYETLHFKVKGDAANLANFEVKFFAAPGEPETSRTYDATSFTALGNDWYQVSVPISDFPTVDTNTGFLLGPFGGQAAPFTFLMTDIGFSGTAAADPGIVPEAVAYSSDPAVAEDFGPPGGIQNFGSGAVFVDVLDDPDFAKVLQTTSGEGYGPGVHVGFAAFPDYAAGFAAGYETLHFKVKGDAANLANFEVKFFAAPGEPETSQTYDATSFTALGNGWYQASIPISDFPTVDTNTGFLLGPFGGQAAPFTFRMTDIGFSTAGGGGLVVNGGFDDGLNGWETFDNGGTITIAATGGSDGGPAANLNVAAPGNPTLKQTGIGIGTIGPNQAFSITFDWKGTAANGGVIDFQVFSEQDGGGVTKADLVQGGDAFPADWTTVGPLNYTTAADVAGGLTLQITAICGGVAGCVSDLFIDNLVISTD